jgi:hypothetical protein
MFSSNIDLKLWLYYKTGVCLGYLNFDNDQLVRLRLGRQLVGPVN